jgi:hypothetical protein
MMTDDRIKKYLSNGGELFMVTTVGYLRDGGTMIIETTKGDYRVPPNGVDFYVYDPTTEPIIIKDELQIEYLVMRINDYVDRLKHKANQVSGDLDRISKKNN